MQRAYHSAAHSYIRCVSILLNITQSEEAPPHSLCVRTPPSSASLGADVVLGLPPVAWTLAGANFKLG